MQTSLVAMRAVSKLYASSNTHALIAADFSLNAGEIHALVGENGAGKTTLAKILCGFEAADSGSIEIRGRKVRFHSHKDAQKAGVALVPQFSMLAPSLSAADNIALGNEPRFLGVFYNKHRAQQHCRELNERYGFSIPPEVPVGRLSLAEQRAVEIMRAVSQKGDILVLDETTSILGEDEAARLYELVKRLKADGKGIVFISHRTKEIVSIADRITVMLGGRVVETLAASAVSAEALSEKIAPQATIKKGNRTIQNASFPNSVCSVSISPGNVMLMPGTMTAVLAQGGSGLDTLEDAVVGLNSEYDVRIQGIPAKNYSAKVLKKKIAYIPSKREERALCLKNSIASNVLAKKLFSYSFCDYACGLKPLTDAASALASFGIDVWKRKPAEHLSGGKRQRLVLARELSDFSEIIVAANPAQGLDTEARALLFKRLAELQAQGAAILIISSDPEDISFADAVYMLDRSKLIKKV